MDKAKRYDWLFWPTLCVLFIPTLFIPVFPIYKGTVMIGMLPVWSMYIAIFSAPELLLFACPVAITHSSLCYLLARRLSTHRATAIRFSILGMITTTGVFSIGLALILAFGPAGFTIFFALILTTLLIGNAYGSDRLIGLAIPALNGKVLIAGIVLCAILVGLALLTSQS